MSLEITPQWRHVLGLFEHGHRSVLLTGKAGTGKSTLLQYFRDRTERELAVLAPTGVAALNVGGETIHSFFRFPAHITLDEAEKRGRRNRRAAVYREIDAIVIDEISMVRADLLDCVDQFLRSALGEDEPFGGKKMIFIGDPYQLPPVVTDDDSAWWEADYASPYFFSARVFADGFDFARVALRKVYRQNEGTFIDLLAGIRNKSISDEGLATINQRVNRGATVGESGAVYLTSTNRKADDLNAAQLATLPERAQVFQAKLEGEFDRRMAPAAAELVLKVGAQVMLLNNHPGGLWVNGTIGKLVAIDGDQSVDVLTPNGETLTVRRHKWNLFRHQHDALTRKVTLVSAGSFTQMPIKLAWAMTIHKSQGKTFGRTIVDFGRGTFAAGQAYVALSRCTSLENLELKQPLSRRDLRVDDRITEFMGDRV